MSEPKREIWPMLTIRERYFRDPAFSRLVDMMQATLEQGQFTPTEMREAAMLAQIKYEETHPRPHTFTKDQVFKGEV